MWGRGVWQGDKQANGQAGRRTEFAGRGISFCCGKRFFTSFRMTPPHRRIALLRSHDDWGGGGGTTNGWGQAKATTRVAPTVRVTGAPPGLSRCFVGGGGLRANGDQPTPQHATLPPHTPPWPPVLSSTALGVYCIVTWLEKSCWGISGRTFSEASKRTERNSGLKR